MSHFLSENILDHAYIGHKRNQVVNILSLYKNRNRFNLRPKLNCKRVISSFSFSSSHSPHASVPHCVVPDAAVPSWLNRVPCWSPLLPLPSTGFGGCTAVTAVTTAAQLLQPSQLCTNSWAFIANPVPSLPSPCQSCNVVNSGERRNRIMSSSPGDGREYKHGRGENVKLTCLTWRYL